MRKAIILLFLPGLFGLLGGLLAADEVVCTIHPYTLVTRQLVGDEIGTTTLIPAGRNPHTYSPTVSDMKKLAEADLIIGNGLQLESMLVAYLEEARKQGGNVMFSSEAVSEEALRKANNGCNNNDCGHHSHHGYNPHIWLHSGWMREYIIPEITNQLVNTFPDKSEKIKENAGELISSLEEFEAKMTAQFSPYRGKKVIINHPSFFYWFEKQGIEEIAVFTGEEAQPSVRTLQNIIRFAQAEEVVALFYEKQFDARKLELLAHETGLPLRELDPLGSTADSLLDFYQTNLEIMLQAFDENQ